MVRVWNSGMLGGVETGAFQLGQRMKDQLGRLGLGLKRQSQEPPSKLHM